MADKGSSFGKICCRKHCREEMTGVDCCFEAGSERDIKFKDDFKALSLNDENRN